MKTTLTHISNIFNLMCTLDDRIKFYHFGYRFDIDRNIVNNWDTTGSTGRLFPAVHFDVPETERQLQEPDFDGVEEVVQVNLYFDDLDSYNNDSSNKTENTIDQWKNLKAIAEDFCANIPQVLLKYNAGHIGPVTYKRRSNLHNDSLLTLEASFALTHYTKCIDESKQIDLSLMPDTIQDSDLEAGPEIVVDECALLLSKITDDLKCCVVSSFDFSDITIQNCLTAQQITDIQDAFCAVCDVNDCAFLLANITDQTKNECVLPTYDFTDIDVRNNVTSQQIQDLKDWLCTTTNQGSSGGGDFYLNGQYYGTRLDGGSNNAGAIFTTDFGVDARIQFNFDTSGIYRPITFNAQDGDILYGLAASGGTAGLGGIFAYDTSTNTLSTLCEFTTTTGYTPTSFNLGFGKAVIKSGFLLIITESGGANNNGTILKININTGVVVVLHDFGSGVTNTGLQTFVDASDGNVYEFTGQQLRKLDLTTNTTAIIATTAAPSTSGGAEFGQPLVELNGVLYWSMREAAPTNANFAVYQYDLSSGISSLLVKKTAGQLFASNKEISLDLLVYNNKLYLLCTGGLLEINTSTGAATVLVTQDNGIRGQGNLNSGIAYYLDILNDAFWKINLSLNTMQSFSITYI